MLTIAFQGYFQCRLATGDDDHNHPRGKKGWTFAFAGEPDLDRVIRFRDPVAPRSHGPSVGVRVHEVEVNGRSQAAHALLGADVELLDSPVFEGRNGAVAGDAEEPIVPFHIRIRRQRLLIERTDRLDLRDPVDLARRKGLRFEQRSAVVGQATGIRDYAKHRADRREKLRNDFTSATNPTAKENLRRRIEELGKTGGLEEDSLGFRVEWEFALRHVASVEDPEGKMGGKLDTAQEWPLLLWMGGWDSDVLCAFASGRLSIPFA